MPFSKTDWPPAPKRVADDLCGRPAPTEPGLHPAAAQGKNSRIDSVAQPFSPPTEFSNKDWLKSTVPSDKIRNCLRWPGPMSNQHSGAFRVVWAALLAALFCIHTDAARAKGVNFELLIL